LRLDDEGKISDDDDVEPENADNEGEELASGSAFEKVDKYGRHLDDPNPWHPHLRKPLFPSQIICFRWMIDRHKEGGGIVGDKVGVGKVIPYHL